MNVRQIYLAFYAAAAVIILFTAAGFTRYIFEFKIMPDEFRVLIGWSLLYFFVTGFICIGILLTLAKWVQKNNSNNSCKKLALCLFIFPPWGILMGIFSLWLLLQYAPKNHEIVEQKKEKTNNKTATASLDKRFFAFFIDMVPASLTQALLMHLFIMLPQMEERLQAEQAIGRNLLITAFSMIFIIFRDVFDGRSLGKRIIKLRVISTAEDQFKAPITALILRNIFVILWPIEALLLFKGNLRLGDRVAKTKLIEIK